MHEAEQLSSKNIKSIILPIKEKMENKGWPGPLITIVIPTQNRPTELERCLSHICVDNVKEALDVIVVDDGSSMGNALKNRNICDKFGVELIIGESRGAPAARNLGAARATTNWTWFIDDDDYPAPESLTHVLEAVQVGSSRVLVLGGIKLHNGVEIDRYTPDQAKCNYEYLRSRGRVANTSRIVAPTRYVELIGGWDERLVAGQDTDFILRLAAVLPMQVLEDAWINIERGSPNRITKAVLRQLYGKLQFLYKHWSILSTRKRLKYLITVVIIMPMWKSILSRNY